MSRSRWNFTGDSSPSSFNPRRSPFSPDDGSPMCLPFEDSFLRIQQASVIHLSIWPVFRHLFTLLAGFWATLLADSMMSVEDRILLRCIVRPNRVIVTVSSRPLGWRIVRRNRPNIVQRVSMLARAQTRYAYSASNSSILLSGHLRPSPTR